MDPIIDQNFNENKVKRYCFNIPKNKSLPEYGDAYYNGNGTAYN